MTFLLCYSLPKLESQTNTHNPYGTSLRVKPASCDVQSATAPPPSRHHRGPAYCCHQSKASCSLSLLSLSAHRCSSRPCHHLNTSGVAGSVDPADCAGTARVPLPLGESISLISARQKAPPPGGGARRRRSRPDLSYLPAPHAWCGGFTQDA